MRTLVGIGLGAAVAALGCGGTAEPAAPPEAPRPTGVDPAAPAAPALPDDEPADPVRFVKAVPSVGDVVRDESRMTIAMDMTVTAGDRLLAQITGRHLKTERRRIEVLAHSDVAVTKAKIEYLEKTEIEEDPGGAKQKTSPLAGKTYLVERRDGDLIATYADGTSVPEPERSIVLREHRKIGKPSTFASFIPDRAVAPGEVLSPPESVVEEMFGDGGDDVKVGDARFVFVGATEDGGGRFDVALKITLLGEPPMDMDMQGRVVVRVANSYPVELLLEGPITIDGVSPKTGARFRGGGRMKLHRRAAYQ